MLRRLAVKDGFPDSSPTRLTGGERASTMPLNSIWRLEPLTLLFIMIRRRIALCLLVNVFWLATHAGTIENLEENFASPPDSARAWVYWFWLNGNISKEGITADLQAMKRAGLGGALWMWGGGLGAGTDKPVKLLSPEWWELMRHAIREADRLGLKLSITSGSGWSHSGGPWIKPKHSMRNLKLAQTLQWDGPGKKETVINFIHTPSIPVSRMCEKGDPAPGVVKRLSIQYTVGSRHRSVSGKDGETLELPSGPGGKITVDQATYGVPDDPVRTHDVRELVQELMHDNQLACVVAYLTGSSASGSTVAAENQVAASATQPAYETGNALEKKGGSLESRAAVDLTDKVDASGLLGWEAPRGAWTVQVFSHGSSGDQPHPIGDSEGGLECDKLNPEAVEENWKGFVLRILNECGPEARRVVRYAHVDSYEFGATTWTAGLLETFKKRCGYEPSPYLPAMFGKVVDSPEISARFMWDFRRLMADLFAEGIGGHLRDLCRAEGMTLTTEPHLVEGVFDQIQYGGHVANPVGNFLAERHTGWYGGYPPVGPEMHLAKGEASAAYTYGLEGVVWAEAFTGTDHPHAWHETLDYLKTWGDLWLSEGINRFCFHCWAHSPWLDRKPGNTLGPWGIHFDRNNTWFDLSTGYLAYLARSQYLLQQGLPVMDVCVLTGDREVDQFPPHPELRANGYDYHGMTTEVLIKDLTVKDGWLVLPSGMRYRLLVTYDRVLRPQTMRKLKELVSNGATVMGEKPEDAPGLTGFPASRDEARKIADEMWGSEADAGQKGRIYGQGRVYWAHPGKQDRSGKGGLSGTLLYLDCAGELSVLKGMQVAPDFAYGDSGKEDCGHMLAYMHRRVGDTDLYFVSSQASRQRQEECVFRIAGRQPQLWDAVTGEMRDLAEYSTTTDGRTRIPLTFEPGQSFFVLFPKTAKKKPAAAENFAELHPVAQLSGSWEVAFDPKWGGPAKVVFDNLEDWTNRPEEGIKYYSGKATYRRTVGVPNLDKQSRVYLDLGKVNELAEVRFNGQTLGVVWCAPWRVEIPRDVLRERDNQLEITVANLWINRLVGDAGLPAEKRLTWTTWNPYRKDSPLFPSGLLGPVTIRTMDRNEVR
jgi:hypothetical protein